MRIYYFAENRRIHVEDNAGTINYETGKVVLTNFLPNAYVGSDLSIIVEVDSYNITPVRNQILLITGTLIDVVDDVTNLRASRLEASTLGSTTSLNQTGVQTVTSY